MVNSNSHSNQCLLYENSDLCKGLRRCQQHLGEVEDAFSINVNKWEYCEYKEMSRYQSHSKYVICTTPQIKEHIKKIK